MELFGKMRKSIKKVIKKEIIAKCGHETKLEDTVFAFGESITTIIRPNKDGSVDCCHKCLGKMAIQCAWCKKPIFVGDPITLYSQSGEKKIIVPSHAVVFNKESSQLVGCGRMSCASTGADYAGVWVPGEDGKGKVRRHSTMLETSLADIKNGGSGVVIR